MTPLQLAAKCAMADLIGLDDGQLDDAARLTIIELYEALQGEGIDVSDYAFDYADRRGEVRTGAV